MVIGDSILATLNWLHLGKVATDFPFIEVTLEIFIVLALAVLASLAFSKIINNFHKRSNQNNNQAVRIIAEAIDDPLHFLVWIYAIYNVICAVPYQFSKNLIAQLNGANALLIYCFIGWFLLRIIDGCQEYIKDHQLTKSKKIDKTLIGTISKILKLIVFITIAIMVLDNLGVKVTGLITFAGIGTAAIGFASKDLFANYLGTLVIFFDKPFIVGDEIDLPEKNIIGIIEEINWRVTKLKTYEHGIIYVPNSYFYNSHIKNNSKINNGRINFKVYIDPKSIEKLEILVSEIKESILKHEFIDAECEHTVVCLNDISVYAPSIMINCSAISNEYNFVLSLKEELMIKVLKILKENKVLPAFDHSRLKDSAMLKDSPIS